MNKYCGDLMVRGVERLSERHVRLRLSLDEPLPEMVPGQFMEVRVDGSPATFLRRPISINYVDRPNNEVWLLIAVVGEGTRRLARVAPGERLNCLFPLGNGFTIPPRATHDTSMSNDHTNQMADSRFQRLLLIGGGVGVAPLLFLGSELRERDVNVTFLLGARTAVDLLETNYFRDLGATFVATEDGTAGERGVVTDHSVMNDPSITCIYCCGPKPMMRAVARYAQNRNIYCEVSLENQMACGVGACLCCVEATDAGYKCVCTDGPVFDARQLKWQT